MANTLLIVEFTLYIISLLIGFQIAKKKKDTHNKKYYKFKNLLFWLISLNLIFSIFIILKTALIVSTMWFFLIFDMLFALYFFFFYPKRNRCWKQHRMLIYNFFQIPLIYYCSLILEKPGYNYYILIICIYNVLEFQFAMFKLKQALIWD